jgi:hypothetical protein
MTGGWERLKDALDRRSEADVVAWLVAASEPARPEPARSPPSGRSAELPCRAC